MKNRNYYIAMLLAGLFHVVLLFAFEEKAPAVRQEATQIIEDVKIQAPPKKQEDKSDEEGNPDAVPLPEEFLAAGLAERPSSSVPLGALVQTVRPSVERPPKPEGMQTIGIPKSFMRVESAGAMEIFSIAELDMPPQYKFQTAAVYPYNLKRMGIEGEVRILCVVNTDGHITQARIDNSTNPEFDKSALDAVNKWILTPGIRKGQKVNFKILIPIKFTLK